MQLMAGVEVGTGNEKEGGVRMKQLRWKDFSLVSKIVIEVGTRGRKI